MSNKKYSKEFKLRLLKEHEENGVIDLQLKLTQVLRGKLIHLRGGIVSK